MSRKDVTTRAELTAFRLRASSLLENEEKVLVYMLNVANITVAAATLLRPEGGVGPKFIADAINWGARS